MPVTQFFLERGFADDRSSVSYLQHAGSTREQESALPSAGTRTARAPSTPSSGRARARRTRGCGAHDTRARRESTLQESEDHLPRDGTADACTAALPLRRGRGRARGDRGQGHLPAFLSGRQGFGLEVLGLLR